MERLTIRQKFSKHEYLLVALIVAAVEIAVGFNSWYFNPTDVTPYPSDAFSRTANAYYALFCDPASLANIGTVWNPLPSILEIPIVWFSQFWKPLVSYGLAGVILTGLFAGGTAALLVYAFRDFGSSRVVSYVMCALFILNPFIFFYGYNGMSEMVSYFFVMLVVFLLLKWMAAGRSFYISAMGFCLMGFFFTRYEAIPFTIGVWLAIMIHIWSSKKEQSYVIGGRWEKLHYCEATSIILVLPIVFGALIWIGFNWAIKGDPWYFLNSSYSNSVQSNFAGQFSSVSEMLGNIALRSLPFLILFFYILIGRFLTKRFLKPKTLILCIVVGSLLGFHIFLTATGKSYSWLRFFSYAFPICMMWLAYELPRFSAQGLGKKCSCISAAIALCIAMPLSQVALHTYDYKAEEDLTLFRKIAFYIEDKVKPNVLLTDSFMTGGILMQLDDLDNVVTSCNPQFDEYVEDPVRMGVRYVLVPEIEGVGASDALLTKHAELGKGQDIPGFTLVEEFSGIQDFYLYKVDY